MVIRPVEGGLNYSCHRVKLVPLLRRGSLQSKAAARPLVATEGTQESRARGGCHLVGGCCLICHNLEVFISLL